ncbi:MULTISPECIES: hypothetical protein [unclassified Streptomyces]|uniref:hypothetical protein n=1 Tax=unclassified Streptomyces TaxID=2593676 RepID=UPI0034229066
MTTPEDRMVAALRRERATYARQGKDDRVAQVDEQLRHLGHTPEPDPDSEPPQNRTAKDPAQQTTGPAAPAADNSGDAGDTRETETEAETTTVGDGPPPAAAARSTSGRRRAKPRE